MLESLTLQKFAHRFTPALLGLVLAQCKTVPTNLKILGGKPAPSSLSPLFAPVVKLTYVKPDGKRYGGTGVLLGDRLIVTNAHIVAGITGELTIESDRATTVTDGQKSTWSVATTQDAGSEAESRARSGGMVDRMQSATDLATVTIHGDFAAGEGIVPFKMASNGVAIGDLVTMIGYGQDDLGKAGVRRYGSNRVRTLFAQNHHLIVVAAPGYFDVQDGRPTQAEANQEVIGKFGSMATYGDSGGALVNGRGELVGLVATGSAGGAYGFFVNLHSLANGRWLRDELAKVGVNFEPLGYDGQSRPIMRQADLSESGDAARKNGGVTADQTDSDDASKGAQELGAGDARSEAPEVPAEESPDSSSKDAKDAGKGGASKR